MFGVSFIPVLVGLSATQGDFLFFFHLGVCGQRSCHSLVEVFFSSEALRWGGGYSGKGFCLSLTVIMQLVFECSYHTNVDHPFIFKAVFLVCFSV